MQSFKRIGLFILVNLLIVVTLTTVYNIATAYFPALRYSSVGGLAFFSILWGMGGAFISLLLSKSIAKWAHGVQIIDPNSREMQMGFVTQTVKRLSLKAGLTEIPEVGIFQSPEINAFATGPSRNNSLVAVSTGLMQRMTLDEIEGVLAHEVAHIANGDMVTMTLLQGITNAFAIFFSRVVGTIAGNSVDEKNRSLVRMICTLVCEVLFTILGSIVVAYFSRQREYRADSGGAFLAGKDKMIGALVKLRSVYDTTVYDDTKDSDMATQALMITSRKSGFMGFFRSHPDLEDRIQALQNEMPRL